MSSSDGSGQAPPAGWYDDGRGAMRWWNGTSWTEHVHQPSPAPSPPQLPAGASAGKPWYTNKLVLVGAAAAAVVIGIASISSEGDEEPAPDAPSAASNAGDEKADDSATAEEVVDEEPEPVDTDGDGINDEEDLDPRDPKVQTRDDVDTDKDGVPDYRDDFPKNDEFSKDTDGDGVADPIDDFPKDERYYTDSDGDKVADAVDAFPADPGRSKITSAMANALDTAASYLDYTAFSRSGLIDQLEFEGYKSEDATWAVDNLKVDWNKQAVKTAEAYLDYSSFSREGLIGQLQFEGFTYEQAVYGTNKAY